MVSSDLISVPKPAIFQSYIKDLITNLSISGLLEPLGLGDGEAGVLERTVNGQLWESWHL